MVPDINGLHIELTNICTLKCPMCARTEFIDSPMGKYWKNKNLDYLALDRFLDIDLTGTEMQLCGNYGDPIYYPKIFEFVQHFKQRGVKFSIVTNGGHKTQEWWEQLCQLLTPGEDEITFSIDGLPETFTKYRRNGDWKSTEIGIKTCVKNNIKTKWKCIVFKFNESDLDEIRSKASSLGAIFELHNSDRFQEEHSQTYKPSEVHLGTWVTPRQQLLNNSTTTVDPRCNTGVSHYISAEGFYSPCCRVAVHQFYYKSDIGKNRKEIYDINQTTLSTALSNTKTVDFYNTLNDRYECQFNCPSRNI